MLLFLKLSIDYPICYTYEINKAILLPGGATKINDSIFLNQNSM